jgi:hypothetical protein
MFSVGSKIYETNQRGDNLRTIMDNNEVDIRSIDYNFETNSIYMADEKNKKVILFKFVYY